MRSRNGQNEGASSDVPHSEGTGNGASDADAWTDDLEEALVAFEQLGSEDPSAALEMFDELPERVQGLFDFRLALAVLHRNLRHLETARDIALRLVELRPDDADVHHLLGDVFEDLEDTEQGNRHFLKTLALDREHFSDVGSDILDRVGRVAERTLRELPAEFAERLNSVPVLVEALPSERQVAGGLDPRLLGLFDGPNHAHQREPGALYVDAAPAPSRVVLFAYNLLAQFGEEQLDEQVRVTVLHEVGHYFGLDEDDMKRLGIA